MKKKLFVRLRKLLLGTSKLSIYLLQQQLIVVCSPTKGS